MKPYWSNEENGLYIYLGDSLEVLPQLEREKFALVCTDFDYFIDNDTKLKWSDDSNRSDNTFFQSELLGDMDAQERFTRSVLDEANGTLVPGGLIAAFHGNQKVGFIWRWAWEIGYEFIQPYVWCKSNPQPQLRKMKWANAVEMASLVMKPPKENRHFNWRVGHVFNYVIHSVGKRDEHPTEKPVGVIMPIVRSWTLDSNDWVLDPFVGSGTTLECCYLCNRPGVGVDIEEKYCEIAARRMEKVVSQCPMKLDEPIHPKELRPEQFNLIGDDED